MIKNFNMQSSYKVEIDYFTINILFWNSKQEVMQFCFLNEIASNFAKDSLNQKIDRL